MLLRDIRPPSSLLVISAVIKLSFLARRPGAALLLLPSKRPHPTFVETTLPQLAGW
jgi:hypothetical protein